MRFLGAVLCCGLLVAACSDDDNGGTQKDQMVVSDSQPPDQGETPDAEPSEDTKIEPDLPLDQNMGEGCTTNSDCKKGSPLCLVLSKEKMLGICSKECTPDDASTPLINEDDCPNGFLCAAFNYTTATYNYCLKKCTPDATKNTCPTSAKQACHPTSTRFGDTDQAVCWYLACQDGKDCPVYSSTTCSNDSQCTSIASDAFCDTDSNKCARPGNCTAAGLCGKHIHGKATAKVGDPCKDDFDCPSEGQCFEESSDPSYIGKGWANGYCTISGCAFSSTLPDKACPTGSTCHHLYYGGICAKTCKLDDANSCRNQAVDKGGDYECYAWNNLFLGSVQITAEPVCQTAAGQTCDSMGSKLDCTSLGETGNPTNMKCRDRFTGVAKTDQTDPNGICLDDTASGPFGPAPDGGPPPPDSGTPDAKKPDAGAPDAATPDAATPDA
jgi:hypothetical protein